ncbi:MAG: hypothetical protein M5R40_23265 [Anaerolineae bacterium]|nr:hypothetical protein [Anaerolineae bacterium]
MLRAGRAQRWVWRDERRGECQPDGQERREFQRQAHRPQGLPVARQARIEIDEPAQRAEARMPCQRTRAGSTRQGAHPFGGLAKLAALNNEGDEHEIAGQRRNKHDKQTV